MHRRRKEGLPCPHGDQDSNHGDRECRGDACKDRARPRLLPVLAAGVGLAVALVFWRQNASAFGSRGRPDAGRAKASDLRRWYAQSDEDVLDTTRQDVRRFVEAKGAAAPSVFGISRGPYSRLGNYTRLPKIAGFGAPGERPEEGSRFTCNFDAFKFLPANSTPPDAPPHASLLMPGLLSQRPNLSNTAQCFLFYAEQLWTRATGGAKGVALARVVAGDNRLGDKNTFAENLAKYQSTCKVPARADAGGLGGFPQTVLLKDKEQCEKFFRENHFWAPEEDSLWFVKDAHGSLGRHIQLLRRSDVRAMAANGSYTCPMPGRVASLEVQQMWVPGKRKFDQRYYVLIPSLDPLIVLVRRGYLRFSAFEYQRERMPGEDAELDRMRHVTNLAIQLYDAARRADSTSSGGGREGLDEGEGGRKSDKERVAAGGTDSAVLQPVSRLREELTQMLGAEEGERAHMRLETSARNSILQVIYAMRHKLQPWDMEHKELAQTWALISMDVAYDTANNAYVLDVNARPAPTGNQHPLWYTKDRSATIREAVDILQEVGFRQLVKAILNQRISPARDASGTSKKHPDHSQLVWSPLSDTYGWDLLFHEALGGVQNETWLRPGECVRTYHRFAPELNQD